MASRTDPEFARAMGRVMKSARKRAGIKASAYAFDLGVTEQTVSNWETGKVLPALANLRSAARLLGVPSHRILGAAERLVVMNRVMKVEVRDEHDD